jgi:hypothetical protein
MSEAAPAVAPASQLPQGTVVHVARQGFGTVLAVSGQNEHGLFYLVSLHGGYCVHAHRNALWALPELAGRAACQLSLVEGRA